jgi:hypothetical protein
VLSIRTALVLLGGVLTGGTAGLLEYLAVGSPPAAFLWAGAGFAAGVGLLHAVIEEGPGSM